MAHSDGGEPQQRSCLDVVGILLVLLVILLILAGGLGREMVSDAATAIHGGPVYVQQAAPAQGGYTRPVAPPAGCPAAKPYAVPVLGGGFECVP